MTNPTDQRLIALDLFRGYTVVGMLIVNFVGGYRHVPSTLGHHHTYCSFADTIMPQFLFAVGLAMRLTMLKRIEREGCWPAFRKAITRGLGLFLLGCVVYKLTGKFENWQQIETQNWAKFFEQLFKRGPFETLTHIGITTLFVLPVIAAKPPIRIAFLIGTAAFHAWLSQVWYYQWNLSDPRGIDGGPLAFFSWAIPLLIGSLAWDALKVAKPVHFAGVGFLISTVAIFLMTWLNPSAWFPFSHWARDPNPIFNYWTMSQRAGSIAYTLFGSGFSLVVFAIFLRFERLMNWSLFILFGQHALAAYLIHEMVAGMVKPFVPKDAPDWYVWTGFTVYFFVTWLFVRYLDRNKLYLRL